MSLAAHVDDLGKPAWFALLGISFFYCWPVGLAILAFLIGSGRMGCFHKHADRQAWRQERHERFARWCQSHGGGRSSGNRAFDDYRADTLRRLEEEQVEFTEFLGRLRFAKDKAEFDQFLAERRNRPAPSAPQPES